MSTSPVEIFEYADVETSSPEYAARFSGPIGEWLLSVQSQSILKLLNSLDKASVLDVAGGHGQIARALTPNGHNVTILGSTNDCDRQVRDLILEQRCKFVSGDVEKLPFNDKSFDVITCFRYLSHTENWRQVISELTRVARKLVIVDYPVIGSVNFLNPIFFRIKHLIEGNTRPFSIFTRAQIAAAFAECNYQPKGSIAQFFMPMALHRLIASTGFSSNAEKICKNLGLTKLFGSPVISAFEPR